MWMTYACWHQMLRKPKRYEIWIAADKAAWMRIKSEEKKTEVEQEICIDGKRLQRTSDFNYLRFKIPSPGASDEAVKENVMKTRRKLIQL